MIEKLTGSAIGTLFGLGAYQFGNFVYRISSDFETIDKIPSETARTFITTAATAGGIVVGLRDYYNSRLARLHGD